MKRRGFFSLLLAPFVARLMDPFAPKRYQGYPQLRANVWALPDPLTEAKLISRLTSSSRYFEIIRIDRHTRTVYFGEV